MVALRLVSNATDQPRHVARSACISDFRKSRLTSHNARWNKLKAHHVITENAERNFSDLKEAVAIGAANQELTLRAAEILNRCCDELRDDYREMLSTHLSPSHEFISFTDANKGEVAQIVELKEVLINARARKALIDYCGKDLTTAAERIAAGADLAWAEREFDYTSQGWVAFKKRLAEQLNKMI